MSESPLKASIKAKGKNNKKNLKRKESFESYVSMDSEEFNKLPEDKKFEII